MSKPDQISPEAFKAAWKCAETVLRNLPDDYGDVSVEVEAIARAIMAAEKRGEEREREACLSACLTELAQAKENGCTQEAMGAHWCAVAIRARSA